MPNLDDPLNLARAIDYFPRARDESALVPVVFGDFLSSTHIHDDGEDGGYLPAIEIDQDNWVYLLNGLPNVDGPIEVYANDTLQESSVYTYTPMGDYGGIGALIAYIQFNTNPGSRAISWNGRGARAWPATTLLTNPVDAIASVFVTYGGWTPQDTDVTSIMETKRLMNVLGDTINMVFWERRTFREWLEIILQLYHTDIGLDAAGSLRFMLDTSVTTQPTNVLAVLDARRDLAGLEAEPLVIRRAPDDIVTEITAHARRKWTTGASATKPRTSYAPGVSLHGLRHREYELPGLYSVAQYERWLRGMWLRYGTRADRVLFTVRGLSLMSALPGQFLGMISPKRGWYVPQLLKVLNCETNDEEQTISFECFDTQRLVDSIVTLPTVVMPSVRTRPIQGSLTVDLVPPGPASNLLPEGSYRRIVLRWTAPRDLDYSHTEIWGAVTNNRALARHIRNGGQGVIPGGACEETFEVGDGESSYVWLMTVDNSGNGRNGAGHWYPSSPTAGIFAASTLVPTPGLEANAVSDQYTQTFTLLGLHLGPTGVVSAFAPSTPQVGFFRFHATAQIQVSSLCTLVLEIRQGSIGGPVSGQAVVPNILTTTISYPFVCIGESTTPVWGGEYGLVAQVLNQAGGQVPYVVVGASFNLNHTKR